MNIAEYWLPYTVTHVVTLLLLFVCYKWPKTGKVAWGVIFILAGLFNVYTGMTNPQAYVEYGEGAVKLYQKFIYGPFSSYTTLFISLIAAGQITVGIFLLLKKKFFLWGILGGITFLLAISPLGVGSAFPSTLLMAGSLVLLYFRYKTVEV